MIPPVISLGAAQIQVPRKKVLLTFLAPHEQNPSRARAGHSKSLHTKL